jgi:hypothetical protein
MISYRKVFKRLYLTISIHACRRRLSTVLDMVAGDDPRAAILPIIEDIYYESSCL